MILTSLALSCLVAVQGGAPDASRPHRSFRFVYAAAVPEVPPGAKRVRLWVPIPLDTPDQTIGRLTVAIDGDGPGGKAALALTGPIQDGQDGGRDGVTWLARDIRGGFGRSLCVESAGTPIALELAFDVTRYETHGGGRASAQELAELKQPDSLIPLDGKVSAVAASLPLPEDPLQAARALYDHTLERMRYDKPEGDKGWGRGDAEWACDAKFGNCTDFHSYFMGLARSRGLPARFEMGFPIPGGAEPEAKVGGYHCWAYVWIEPRGWTPVDISEADKQPARSDYFFGTLDADRVTMSGGRDLFVYPYAEADGKKLDGVTKAFKRINP